MDFREIMRVFIESLRVIFRFFFSFSLSLCFRVELIPKKVFVKTELWNGWKDKDKKEFDRFDERAVFEILLSWNYLLHLHVRYDTIYNDKDVFIFDIYQRSLA